MYIAVAQPFKSTILNLLNMLNHFVTVTTLTIFIHLLRRKNSLSEREYYNRGYLIIRIVAFSLGTYFIYGTSYLITELVVRFKNRANKKRRI